jgi:hypothetical protein
MHHQGYSHTLRQRVWLLLVLILAIAGTSSAQLWVASTGTVDEGSRGTLLFTGGVATLRPILPVGSATIRYNVLPVGNLVQPITQACCESRALMVRYQDNGPGAQVIVTLKSYNVHTGEVTTVLTFDSNQHPQESGFQEPVPAIFEGSFFNFNFAEGPTDGTNDRGGDSIYYIEAQLIKSAPGGNPGLASVRIVTVKAP